MPLLLRPATATDLAAIAQLMNLAYRGSGAHASWTTEAPYIRGDRTSEAYLRDDLASSPQAVFLVPDENPSPSLQACVFLKPISPTTWYLGSLAIDPTLQNAGLGRSLLHAAELWAARRGATTIQISVVHVRDTLLAWYQRRGYHLTGEVHPFPYGDPRVGAPLREDLTFVILEKCLPPRSPTL